MLISTVILIFSFSNSHGQQLKKDSYLINGNFKGIDSGRITMLSANGTIVLDSAVIVNGKFCMQGKVGTPDRLLFNAAPGNWNFMAFVENVPITLFIDTAGAQHQGSGKEKWSLIWEIKESGSEMAEVYRQYKTETRQKHYYSIFSALRQKLKENTRNNDSVTKWTQEMDLINSQLLTNQKIWIENYISQYPSSIAGAYIFNEFYESYVYYQSKPAIVLSYLNSILNKFSEPAKSSIYYIKLVNETVNLSNIQTGSQAPDFTLLKTDKSKFSLSSTRGTYTLIDFWASWCIPCRKAIPVWKEIFAKYKDKGFTIVAVSSDRNWNDWIKALEKEQMPWEQVIDEFPNENDPAQVTELFGSNGLPFYVLLDKAGIVLIASGDKDIIRKKIEEIFEFNP